jgi:hypothetical protein
MPGERLGFRVAQIEVVKEFAAALDRQDYEVAGGLLAPDCTYRVRSKVLVGPDAIIGSYKDSAQWGAAHIDSVEYRSRVEPIADSRFVIRFEDCIQHLGKNLTHATQQLVELNASGKIRQIEHQDLPGEVEALEAFFRAAGIDRGSR